MLQSKQNRYDIKSAELKKTLPRDTGVYLFRDNSDKVLYVGKAKNIRNRVSSYLKPAAELTRKTEMMMSRARFLEFMITDTENEAFILEGSLIKKHMPRYNVILRDDKQYPYLRMSVNEPYPRLEFVRKMKNDKAIYFGPYSSSGSVRSTMKLIERIFRLRKCTKSSMNRRTRPCLNYQLDRCLAPCTYDVPVDKYQKVVEKVRLFLEGRSKELRKKLESDMKELALEEKFEEAARVRDQIRAVERTVEKQNVVSTKREDQDIIGVAQGEGAIQVVIFFSRKGIITGNRDFRFENENVSSSEVMEAFLKQYYYKTEYMPGNILVSQSVDDLPSIRKWLSDKAGKKISIHRPVRGKKVSLVNLAVKNA
ncbi:excinuclease ABC subunit UvrC, partial [Thermodesulfobacteriota bacterium]